jgi:hypothetical protein
VIRAPLGLRSKLQRLRRAKWVPATSISALAALVAAALAYWTGLGTLLASASVATLPAPSISSAVPGPESVSLSWAAVAPPGAGTVTYYVLRDGLPTSGGCPSSGNPSTATSCVDGPVPTGTHTYTITALWRTWTARSATKTVTVTSGAVTHFVVEAASTTLGVGEPDSLTIVAKDAANNTVTSYAGAHNLTFGGSTASPNGTEPTVSNEAGAAKKFGEATAIHFSEGKAVVAATANGVMRLYRAGEAHITAKEGSITNGTGLAVVVRPGAASALKPSQPTPSEPETGAAFSTTITALDLYGNTATSYGGAAGETKTIAYSGPESAPSGKAPEYPSTATSVTFKEGVGTATGLKLYKAAATTLTVKEGTKEGSVAFTVKASSATALRLFFSPAEATAGVGDEMTIRALDAYENLATSYANGSHSLTFSGALAGPNGKEPLVIDRAGLEKHFGQATEVSFTGGEAKVESGHNGALFLYRVEEAHVKVTDGAIGNGGAGQPLKVKAGEAKSFKLSAPTPAEPEAAQALSVTLTALDAGGNTATSYGGAAGETKTIAYSGPENAPSGKAPEYPSTATSVTFKEGVGTATALKLYKAAATTLTAKEGTREGSASFTVKPGAPKGFGVVPVPAEPEAGVAFEVKLTAWDEWHNTVTNYARTNRLKYEGAESSPNGKAPEYSTITEPTFTNGVATVTGFKLYKAGSTTLKVAEEVTGRQGSGTFALKASAAFSLKLSAPTPAEPEAGAPVSVTISALDIYGNVATGYGGTEGVTKTIAYSGPESAPNGKAPEYPSTATTVTFREGVATATGIRLFKAAATTLTAKEGTHEASVAFTVKPGPLSSFGVTANPAEPVAGTAFEVKLTAFDEWHNTITNFVRTHKLAYRGAEASPSGQAPEYSTITEPTFANGQATVTGFKLYNAALTTLVVTEEVSGRTGTGTVTVKPEAVSSLTTTTGHFAWERAVATGGTLTSPCLFTCEDPELGQETTFKAHVAVTDQYGNVESNLGAGHTANVGLEQTGRGTITGTSLTIPAAGRAESAGEVEFSTPSKGGGNATLTASAESGTAYHAAKAKLHF